MRRGPGRSRGGVVARDRSSRRFALELRLHEPVEVPVQDRARVRRLVIGSEVLDHLVGVEDVAADLVAPTRGEVLTPDLAELFLPLLELELEQPRLQDPDRHLAVLGGRPLVLAGDHDPGRDVREPDRWLGLLDVLAAGTRRSIVLLADLVPVELDGDGVVAPGHALNEPERRLPALLRVVGADPDEPMDAALSTQPAVGE